MLQGPKSANVTLITIDSHIKRSKLLLLVSSLTFGSCIDKMRRISNSRHTCRLNMLTNSTSTTQNDDTYSSSWSQTRYIHIYVYIYNYICVYLYIYICVCDHIYCNPYRGEYIAGIYNWVIIWFLSATDCTTGMQPQSVSERRSPTSAAVTVRWSLSVKAIPALGRYGHGHRYINSWPFWSHQKQGFHQKMDETWVDIDI